MTAAPWQPLQRGAAIGLVLIGVLRCFITFAPHIAFDNDPATFYGKSGGLGPSGSMWLDVTTLILAGLVLLSEWKINRRMPWSWILLGALPIPIVFIHGLSDAGDLWRGTTWIAAVWAAIALAHAARDQALRPILIALAASVVVPLLLRGGAEVSWEHDAMVQEYRANRDVIFADRGWTADSPSARIFERRVMQRQPDAWFISTNIFATFMAVGMIGALGVWRAARARSMSWTLITALIAGACGALLFMTGSKGGLGVAAIGIIVLLSQPLFRRWPRLVQALPMLLVGAVLLGIVVRGTVLPEGFAGDKSLLFRWHYFNAAASALADEPLLGTGPDGFQRAATEFRHPRNPEETAFTHSIFVDWLATLGLAGGAWVLLMALMSRVRSGDDDEPSPRTPESDRMMRFALIVGAVIAVGVPLRLETGLIDATGLGIRLAGMIGYAGLAWLLWCALHASSWARIQWMLISVLCVVLMHGQMELTLTDPSSCVWALMWVGLALPARAASLPSKRSLSTVVAATIPLVTAALIIWCGAIPAGQQEAATLRAARVLWPTIQERQAGQPVGPRVMEERRLAAAEELQAASQAQPTALLPLLDAAREYERAALGVGGDRARRYLDSARSLAEDAVERFDSDAARVQVILLIQLRAQLDNTPSILRDALPFAEQLVEHDPLGIASWKRLGDLHWELGDAEKARSAYAQALKNNRALELDVLKQLPDAERQRLEERMESND